MAGIQNNILFSNGRRLEPSTATDISNMQETVNDVSDINFTGTPEGAVAANPGSICRDPASGIVYIKQTGTGNTGWAILQPLPTVTGYVTSNGTSFFGRTLTNGGNVDITNPTGAAGNSAFTVTGGGFIWNNVTGTSQTFFSRNGYFANHASTRIDFNLNALSTGDAMCLVGVGAGGWRLNATGGTNQIRIGNQACTIATGYLESTNQYDCIEVIALGSNRVYVRNSIGNINVV